MIDGKLTKAEVLGNININKKFVLIDSSKYTEDAYNYILGLIDEAQSIGFISDLGKIYAMGQYYNNIDELKYFSSIVTKDASGEYTSDGMLAPNKNSVLTFTGKGYTYITANATTGEVIVDTDLTTVTDKIDSIGTNVNDIISSYASTTYVYNNYQSKLIAGTYISLSDNVISTYGLPTFTYLLNNYATSTYATSLGTQIDALSNTLSEYYSNTLEVQSIAYDAAFNAINAVIDNAPDAFDTLKELSDWIISSGKYVTASEAHIAANPTDKYYVKTLNENNTYVYVDAPYDTNGNVIATQPTYIYVATTAADIISDIQTVNSKLGNSGTYTYVDLEGNTKEFTGSANELIPTANPGEYLYETIDSTFITVTYNNPTGIYKNIDDVVSYLNQKITNIEATASDVTNVLYYLYVNNTSSYAYITLTPNIYTEGNDPGRTINTYLVEGKFNNGEITQNGLATTYTVNDMIDYVNGWVIL